MGGNGLRRPGGNLDFRGQSLGVWGLGAASLNGAYKQACYMDGDTFETLRGTKTLKTKLSHPLQGVLGSFVSRAGFVGQAFVPTKVSRHLRARPCDGCADVGRCWRGQE